MLLLHGNKLPRMAHDPFDIQGQDDARKDAEDKARRAAVMEKDDLVWLMSNKRGRRVMYRLLERAGVWRSSFHTNALQMAFNEGSRNEGLYLFAKLAEACPESYSSMLEEHRKDV